MKTKLLAVLVALPLGLVSCVPPTTPSDQNVPPDDLSMVPMGTAQTYVGTVGALRAVFTLTWQDDGNVVGNYYHSDDSKVVFKLKGKNTSPGELVLTEYSVDKQTAILTLKKSVAKGLIVWSGKMHNTDGRVLDVSMTRQADR